MAKGVDIASSHQKQDRFLQLSGPPEGLQPTLRGDTSSFHWVVCDSVFVTYVKPVSTRLVGTHRQLAHVAGRYSWLEKKCFP